MSTRWDTSGASSSRAFRAPLLETCWKHPYLLGGLMKKIWLCLPLVSLLALTAVAQEKEEKEDKEESRVENAGKVFKEILDAPDSIPQDVLDKADCVVILPSVLKFAIGFGGSYGRAFITCRGGSNFNRPWRPPPIIPPEGGR